ncbi:hypothetical protein Q5P01_003622 [Channa striata]|uniref:Poly [ADP-ribose] polymerase n=1 Tax=Channa striata TaxID=64152 RepID=A0AA88NJX9_CHASR|nr:hypothetical protein Q5P01_003622 [Channa striata]
MWRDEDVEFMDTSDTPWYWYYFAECGQWHKFEDDPNSSLTSENIEKYYLQNSKGVLNSSSSHFHSSVDFSAMLQTELNTNRQRRILRGLYIPRSCSCFTAAPVFWEHIDPKCPYQLIQLGRDTYEFKEVARLYERTMDHPIKSIQRIQNLDLWEFFCRKKTQLRKVKRTLDIEERMLFHGTGHSNIQAICTFNFDWRLTGSHGDVYGKGSYFARDAKYSSKFCHTTGKHNTTLQRHGLAPPIFASEPHYKTMFLARVLVGEYTVGHPMYCRPPSKDASFTNFYDSCVDDMANPKIYVIFDSNQIYPEYLIEFY